MIYKTIQNKTLSVILFSILSIFPCSSVIPEDSSDSDLSGEEIEILLKEHNRVRADVKQKELTWSGEIAQYSKAWADKLAKGGCKFEHRPRSGQWKQIYGENLFMGTKGYYGVADAVKSWESEKKFYKSGSPIKMDNHFYKIGHYTQIVWYSTEQVGCGKSFCKNNMIVVCNYNPAGNMIGDKPF